ncbi:hypothetical protein COCMIDRAFT_93816, partial [Bipolaris oryzae ATCC 44560]
PICVDDRVRRPIYAAYEAAPCPLVLSNYAGPAKQFCLKIERRAGTTEPIGELDSQPRDLEKPKWERRLRLHIHIRVLEEGLWGAWQW